MKYLMAFTFLLIFFSCKENSTPAFEDEIMLEVGQTFSRNILGENYDITLMSVDENSLCPKTLYCFWGGRIIITLRINRFDYQLGHGDENVSNDALVGNKTIKIIDAYDYFNDKSQWIKLKLD